MAVERQTSALPPAQPSYIFRGHTAQIHSVQIVRDNRQLLTGDADGWIVLWKLESKRPVAVWKAHEGAILGTAEWGPDRIITHGRDNSLRIWQISPPTTTDLSTVLPIDNASVHRPKPWLLHTLPANTLNFCAFSAIARWPTLDNRASSRSVRADGSILVAVPARDDHKIEIYQFPEEKLAYVVPRVQSPDTGMVMAVKLAHHQPSNNLIVLAGYEGGYTAVHLLEFSPNASSETETSSILERAQLVYLSKPHSQPVLSLDGPPDGTSYFTSSADAIIAKHTIPDLPSNQDNKGGLPHNNDVESSRADVQPVLDLNNAVGDTSVTMQHPAQQDPTEPTTEGIPTSFEAHVETAKSPDAESIEPLDFSKKPITSTHLANASTQPTTKSSLTHNKKPSGLSSLLATAGPQSGIKPKPAFRPNITVQPAHKTVQTKHAGQQSLNVRSDGRLLVTGGWDSRVRVYSTKTLKEMAVLKWNKEGIYATHFSVLSEHKPNDTPEHQVDARKADGPSDFPDTSNEVLNAQKESSGMTRLQNKREEQIQAKHWVVAGAKDGKVSLWEVF